MSGRRNRHDEHEGTPPMNRPIARVDVCGRRPRSLRATFALAAVLALPLALLPQVASGSVARHAAGGSTTADVVGADADQLGTSWYPDAGISPAQVNSKDFGQLYDITLPSVDGVPPGQIYAQPVVSGGTMLVVTEDDNAYALDPTTGAVEWSRNFGTAWQSATINCADLEPDVGITGTPVIDTATGIAYFVTDTTPTAGGALWQMQAVSLATGDEVPNFPVTIAGPAVNAPSQVFDPVYQGQRPGLAMVNGEVYAAFGSHCDYSTWYGWIAGVTTAGDLHDLWVDETGTADGAGIWGPGGLAVDSAGNIYAATGNGGSPSAGPGLDQPQPSGLAECVIKLSTSGPHLQLADYFCPDDAATLNSYDGDLGSGSPTGLPPSFGTSTDPDLLVEVGKSGEVYLLDRDDLGGVDQGPGGTDDVVGETGPRGGAWSHPAVWPGDGGYVYITTGGPGSGSAKSVGDIDVYQRVVTDGQVSLNWVGEGPGTPFGSGAPIVTSDDMDAGSAVVWDIVRKNESSDIAQLDAFGAVPVAGSGSSASDSLPLLWHHTVGNSTKFNAPLAYDGRIYVANYDGQIRAYGLRKSAPPLTAAAVNAPDTVVGSTSPISAMFTASADVTVRSASITVSTGGASGAFTVKPLAAPVKLTAGKTLTLAMKFVPQVVGGQQGTLTVTTNLGTAAVSISGRGVPEGVPIAATPTSVDFGVQPIGGGVVSATVSLQNTSSSPFTVESVEIESGAPAPFSLGELPDPLPTVAPGGAIDVPVDFTPPSSSGNFVQYFTDHLVITTTAGEATVPLAGQAAPPPQITISSLDNDVGTVAVGQSGIVSFTVGNRGGTSLAITKSKPPTAEGFSAVTSLSEGSVIPAHETVVETVRFSPTGAGPASATWVINGDDTTGIQTVTFTGTGADEHRIASPLGPGWHLSGKASVVGHYVQLTGALAGEAGGDFFGTPVSPSRLRASFSATLRGGTGGDGITFALVDASGAPAAPGLDGSGLGLAGLPAVAVALQTSPSTGDPHPNSIGVVTSTAGAKTLTWLKTANSASSLRGISLQVTVIVRSGALTVELDGFTVLTEAVTLPPHVYVGFTGSTGRRTDRHRISAVQISYG